MEEMLDTYNGSGCKRNSGHISVEKPKGKREIERWWFWWQYNIKIFLKHVTCEDVYWIQFID